MYPHHVELKLILDSIPHLSRGDLTHLVSEIAVLLGLVTRELNSRPLEEKPKLHLVKPLEEPK